MTAQLFPELDEIPRKEQMAVPLAKTEKASYLIAWSNKREFTAHT